MKLTKGLKRDEQTINAIPESWIRGKNGVFGEKTDAISNEDGFDKEIVKTFYNAIGIDSDNLNGRKIHGVIKTPEEAVIFSVAISDPTDVSNPVYTGEIGRLKDGIYTTVVVDSNPSLSISSAFGFKPNRPIKGKATYKFNNDLIVVWNEGVFDDSNTTRIMNLNCLPFEVNADRQLIAASDARLLALFGNSIEPIITLAAQNSTGGRLKTGQYFFFCSYIQRDSSETNKFAPINGSVVIKETLLQTHSAIEGAPPESDSTWSLTLKFDNLDLGYKYVRLYVLKIISGVAISQKVIDLDITTSSMFYTYTGYEDATDVSLDEATIQNPFYDKSEGVTAFNDTLLLGNLTTDEDLDIQKIADKLIVEWTIGDADSITFLHDKSNKTPIYTQKNKTFMFGEVYALYLIPHYTNGRIGKSYHIPGRYAFAGDTDAATETEDLALGGTVKKFQTRDTSTYQTLYEGVAPGQLYDFMSYWENKDEVYKSCFSTDFDGGALEGERVRHHKFPSLNTVLDIIGADRVIGNDTSLGESVIDNTALWTNGSGDAVAHFNTWSTLPTSLIALNNGVYGDNGLKAVQNVVFNLEIFELRSEAFTSSASAQFEIRHFKSDGTMSVLDNVVDEDVDAGTIQEVQVFKTIRLDIDEWIEIYVINGNGLKYNIGSTANVNVKEIVNLSSFTLPLGIKVSNFIPNATIYPKISYFEIGFAKRTAVNSTILGEGLLQHKDYYDLDSPPASNTTHHRFNCVDLLYYQPILSGSYLEIQSSVVRNYQSPVLTPADIIRQISASSYKLLNNSAQANKSREATVVIDTVNDYDYGTLDTFAVALLRAYKENVYQTFNNQLVSRTGYLIQKGNISVPASRVTMFDGDCFNTMYGFYTHQRNELDELMPDSVGHDEQDWTGASSQPYVRTAFINYWQHYICIQSSINCELRHTPITATSSYEGFFPNVNMYMYARDTFFSTGNKINYDASYSRLNDFIQNLIYKCDETCTEVSNKYPSRVIRSEPDGNEEYAIGWKTFKPKSYHEIVKGKGCIVALNADSTNVYISLEHTTYVTTLKDRLLLRDDEVYLAAADIFDRPPIELAFTDIGYAGCQSRFGTLMTVQGLIFVDRKHGKVFFVKGTSPIDISDGLINEFDDSLDLFEDVVECPSSQTGFLFGFDANDANRRFLMTKKDYEPTQLLLDNLWDEESAIVAGTVIKKPSGFYYLAHDDGGGGFYYSEILFTDTLYFINKCFTLSYSFQNNAWAFYHDYIPDIMYETGNGLHSVKNTDNIFNSGIFGSGVVYKHNVVGKCGTFYEGIAYPFYIDVPFNERPTDSKTFNTIKWISDVYDRLNSKNYMDKTITHIMVYNENQCSELIELEENPLVWFDKNRRDIRGTWNFNKFKDVLINQISKFIDDKGELITSAINYNAVWYEKRLFISKFIVVRFYFDNSTGQKLFINEVAVEANQIDTR